MQDWFKGTIPVEHFPLTATDITQNEFTGELKKRRNEWKRLTSPEYPGASIQYRSSWEAEDVGEFGPRKATGIVIDGNPAMFMQGQNVHGWNTMQQTYEFIEHVLKLLNINPRYAEPENTDLTRIDIAESGELESQEAVYSYMEHVARISTYRGHQASPRKFGGVMYNAGNQYHVISGYGKGKDIRRRYRQFQHMSESEYARLCEYADHLFRLELRMQGRQLTQEKLRRLGNWQDDTASKLYSKFTSRIDMMQKPQQLSKYLKNLRPVHRATYAMYIAGIDPRLTMTRATFFRHKAYFKKLGVDLAVPYLEVQEEVMPISEAITVKRAECPEFMK